MVLWSAIIGFSPGCLHVQSSSKILNTYTRTWSIENIFIIVAGHEVSGLRQGAALQGGRVPHGGGLMSVQSLALINSPIALNKFVNPSMVMRPICMSLIYPKSILYIYVPGL